MRKITLIIRNPEYIPEWLKPKDSFLFVVPRRPDDRKPEEIIAQARREGLEVVAWEFENLSTVTIKLKGDGEP
jgi:hypothetical protein